MLTTLEECSEGEAGGWRTAWRVGLPPFSMFRWDSDSVRSDSPPSEDRNAFSGGHARFSMLPSGWYLETQTHRLCALHYSSRNDMFCFIGFLKCHLWTAFTNHFPCETTETYNSRLNQGGNIVPVFTAAVVMSHLCATSRGVQRVQSFQQVEKTWVNTLNHSSSHFTFIQWEHSQHLHHQCDAITWGVCYSEGVIIPVGLWKSYNGSCFTMLHK